MIGLLSNKIIDYYPATSLKSLGSGTYSKVELYSSKEKFVAIKFSVASVSDGLDPSFLREAACLVKMSHPNVIGLQDVILYPNKNSSIALVLPLAKNNLYQMMDILSVTEKKLIALQILRGVAYIQSHGIYHGDLKPQNVLLYEADDLYFHKAVITDFGLARAANCSSISSSLTFFTVIYRPPELFLGGKYTKEGDIWALGIMLLELFTGEKKLLYVKDNDDDNTLSLIFKIFGKPTEETWPGVSLYPKWYAFKDSPPYPLRNMRQLLDVSTLAYANLLNKMLQLDPKKRSNFNDLMNDSVFDPIRYYLEVPSLKANSIVSLNCGIYVLDHKAPMLTKPVYKHSLTQKLNWLISLQNKWALDYRTLILALYLFKYYVGSNNADLDLSAISALILASKVTEAFPLYIETALSLQELKNIPDISDKITNMERDILESYGIDLYASTTYDILKTLIVYYSDETFLTSISYLLISYHAEIYDVTQSDIALACLYLACQMTQEDFLHLIDADVLLYVSKEIKKTIPNLLELTDLSLYKVGSITVESLLSENNIINGV